MVTPFQCTEEDMQWAGMSCSEDSPCPVYLELAAVEPVGNKIFAAGNIHSETVTLFSVILGSEDTGKTWREVHDRIRGAGLDHIQFNDFANGWISGEALSPLSQDPFLLITTDGGKSWKQRPLFSETRVGSIQQFSFSSKNDGRLVIDRGQGSGTERYELYESPDGGETWEIKQASNKPIVLKAGAAIPTEWRVRADGPTRSFRIEHRQSDRWTTAASFALNLGSCKPAPLQSREPSDAAPEPVPTPAPPRQAPSLKRPNRGK